MVCRNYANLHANPDVLDEVIVEGHRISIPAPIGSVAWGVLKAAYLRPNQLILSSYFTNAVAEIMRDRDAEGWERYQNKPDCKPWEERIKIAARLLTRRTGNHPYGLRLEERGHRFKLVRDGGGHECFVLHCRH